MQDNSNLVLNGKNIEKTRTTVEVVIAGDAIDITGDCLGIEYTISQEKEYGYNLGVHPTHYGLGAIEVEGTLMVTDGGIAALEDKAATLGGVTVLDLGQTVNTMNILVTYRDNTNTKRIEELQAVMFTENARGVNKDTILNEREIPFIAGKLVKK